MLRGDRFGEEGGGEAKGAEGCASEKEREWGVRERDNDSHD